MANGFGSMYIGASGLQGAQNALNTTANNLANVGTEGYVRQQVRFIDKRYDMIKNPTKVTNAHQSGLGVSIGDVVHARDVFLDKSYRLEKGREAFYETCYETTSYVEDLLQELDGEEFKQSVEDIWIAFQELSKTPADSVTQNLVIQKAELLLSRSENLYIDLQGYQANIDAQIVDNINRVNEIGNRIHELSMEIQKVESNRMETAMTLRDERDHLVDELSGLCKIDVREDDSGFMFINIEGVEFVNEQQCFEMGTTVDKATGFSTPIWPHLSDDTKGEYTKIFRTEGEISSEMNTDIGEIKAQLLMRGDEYGVYSDLLTAAAYGPIEDKLLIETQAQVDLLLHEIVTTMNNIFCPNTEIELTQDMTINGIEYKAGDKIKVLDEANSPVGSDGKLPPRELFERMGTERYTVMEINGRNYYVYNEENPNDPNTLYRVGNLRVNDDLTKQVTLLPAFTQNGAVDYALGARLSNAWNVQGMHINPSDQYPCTFQVFYDKMIGKLGTDGSVYKSSMDTMTNTVTSIDNSRQQIMGVSSDEELTKLIKYQSAYNASSRFMTVISQMTELIVTGLI
ncbi:MAG: flagellar hook-associated protein FlgK [Agathobacter sp.]|nr:flagellar hook-associated protein FlgK [Agathobacter sp.]